MKKVNLAVAIKAYRKGVNNRNIDGFCKQVNKTIDSEIKKRRTKIDELKDELGEKKEEAEIQMVDKLLNVDEERMANLESKKEYAASYIKSAVDYMNEYDDALEALDEEIAGLEEEIKAFEKLKERLATISLKEVEETPDNE